ncbi:MAG: exodeoxyribonuclease VII large subunit [Prevotellaceae bacterium]|jgi:exodeoxyribonuclease VII large subunit|nr:exodeoxyribonuclease VII large subunit [Prevotellaceae bacterium]
MQASSITLSELQQRIKQTLERALTGSYWITAEINELKTNAAGHCYIELIEKNTGSNAFTAKANAIIWAYSFRLLKPYFETSTGCALKAGIRVLVKAAVQYHPLYGLSLAISDIDPAYTVGEQAMLRRKTIARLQDDGVFDMNRETPFPLLPQRIAVISSEQAAGYRDFMNHLHNNEYAYAFRTQLFPSSVQGATAAQSIIANLSRINERREAFDVVALIRGGGSAADLACFDEYELASHVAQFPLPVLTGIGHEKDESVVDMVAHTALKTPTAVADFLIDCLSEQENRLLTLEHELKNALRQRLQMEQNRLETMAHKQKMAVRLCFQRTHFRLQILEQAIRHQDPTAILARGYAVVSLHGKTLLDAAGAQENDRLDITLHKGKLYATVNGTQ